MLWQALRGAWKCRVDENGHLNSANFRLQKRSAQLFNKRFSSQKIKKWLIVNLPFQCGVVTSRLQCRWLTLIFDYFVDACASSDAESNENIEGTLSSSSVFPPAADGAVSVWEQRKICLDIARLCGAKQTAKQNAYKLYTWFKFSVTAHWRNIAKYIGLENTTLEHFSWRVQGDSDRVALSSPLSRKKKMCKHQPPAICEEMHLECKGTHNTFINNCLHSIGPNGAVPYAKRQESGSEW